MSQLQIEGKQILDQYNFSIAKLNQVSLSKNFLQNKQTKQTKQTNKQNKQNKQKKKKEEDWVDFHSYSYLVCEVQI